MRKEISSTRGYIIFYKTMNLLVFGFIFSVLIYHLILDLRLILVMIGHGIFFIYFIFWGLPFLFRISKVELSEKGFFIENASFFSQKEIFVPFEKIKVVSQDFLQRGRYETITIEFLESTEFGNKVDFFPNISSEGLFFWSQENEMVEELNRLVRKNKDAESVDSASPSLKLN